MGRIRTMMALRGRAWTEWHLRPSRPRSGAPLVRWKRHQEKWQRRPRAKAAGANPGDILRYSPRPQMAHHRHRLPNALAPAALGTLPPRTRSPTGAPRRSAAGRLPPSPAPIPSPTANAPGSGGGAVRGRLTHGGGGSQLRPAPRPAACKGRGLSRKEAGPARGGGYCEFNYKE